MPKSSIDQRTIDAYRHSEYWVHAEPPYFLRVGRVSPELLADQRARNLECSAFITACNPYSQILDAKLNAARQSALASELTLLKLPFLPGIGKHPDNQWPGEDSFLVFGLPLDEARSLALRHAQNALIWTGSDGIPLLVLLR